MSSFSGAIEDNFSVADDRLRVKHLGCGDAIDDGKEVIEGLRRSQKSLPPRYFYDDRGSQLFEQICQLPEYYPTRTEAWILRQYAREIVAKMGVCEIVELGSGSSSKTRLLLDAWATLDYPMYYVPIDVSAGILKESARQLLLDYPTLKIQALVGTYDEAIAHLPPSLCPRRMMVFLGSTLGNFTPAESDRFFAGVTGALTPGDYFLLGIDLQKSPAVLEAAYNDSQGITAAFNLNMLTHLNRRFQGNFDLDLFSHQAIYNQDNPQIEMYLTAARSHVVRLDTLDLTVEFSAGETLLTEISRKFDLMEMQQYLKDQGLDAIASWSDPQQWFGVLLCQVQ